MTANSKAKLKILYLRRILEEETDAEHGLTMAQIIERLAEYGIEAERKGVYRDIAALREFGLDVKKYERNPVEYAVDRRDFSLPQLMLMVDAVESSKFLTRRQAAMLVGNIKSLASSAQQKLLDRRIHVVGRVRSKNDSVFGFIDVIHEAMRARRKVSFTYYRYGVDGQRHATRGGKPHVVTPVGIVYDEGFYYLTAWIDRFEDFTDFRIDRMGKLRVVDERAAVNDEITHHAFDETAHEYFGRFGGEEVTVTLAVRGDKVEIVLDRFGEHAEIAQADDDEARAVVKVRKSQQFFGWVAGLGGAVRIEGPDKLVAEYRAYLEELLRDA